MPNHVMNRKLEFQVPNISEMIQKSLNEKFSPENIQGIIDECCNNVITEAIKDQFGWNGNLKSQLTEHVKHTINVDTDRLPIPEFTNLVAEGFKKALKGMEDDTIRSKAEKLMDGILQSAPREIKFSKLVKEYISEISDKYNSELRESDNEVKYDGDAPYKSFELEYQIDLRFPDTSCLDDHKVITIDSPDISDDDHKLLICGKFDDNGNLIIERAMNDRRGASNIQDMDMSNWHHASDLHKLLYKMIHRGTLVIMDESDVECEFTVELEYEVN